MGINEVVDRMTNEMNKFKEDLVKEVEGIPDNPKIHRLSACCFTILSSDLKDSWSPMYYDSLKQSDFIIELVRKADSFDSIKKIVDEIVSKGTYRVHDGSDTYTARFNEDVRDYLNGLL